MAQDYLSVNYPGQSLESMFASSSPLIAQAGWNQQQAAEANQAQNQQFAQQAYQQNEQMNPLLLEHQRGLNAYQTALTGETNARIPGVEAESGMKQLDLKKKQNTFDDELEATRSTLKKQISDNDAAILANHGKQYAQLGALAEANGGTIPLQYQSQLPPEAQAIIAKHGVTGLRKAGEMMMSVSADREADREKQAAETKRAFGVAGISANAALQSMKMQIDAGRFAKYNPENMLIEAMFGKNFQQAANAYTYLAKQFADKADAATDPNEKQQLLAQAQQYKQLADAKTAQDREARSAAAATNVQPKVNPAGLGLPTIPQPQPTQNPINIPQPSDLASPGKAQYQNADAVKQAFQAGKLSRDQAKKILQEQFGMK